jgi:hypothetical protein
MNFETSQPTPEQETPKTKSFDVVAQELLHDESLRRLQPHERGAIIADRFIGSVVRHGEVQGSKQNYSPEDVLRRMDLIGTTFGNEQAENLMRITGTDGLRTAVLELASDADVAMTFGHLEKGIIKDEEGNLTLTSPAQIEGYLLSGGDKNDVKGNFGEDVLAEQWVPVIMEHVQHLAQNPDLAWRSATEARELIATGGELNKNTGRDWLDATYAAEKAGVDITLLKRSAEKVQQRPRNNMQFGKRALFLATGSMANAYAHELYGRSGLHD